MRNPQKQARFSRILCVGIFAALLVYLGYAFFFSKEKEMRTIGKAISLLVIYGAALFGIQLKCRPSFTRYRFYADRYKEILGNAFLQDRASRRKLLQAVDDYNQNRVQKALKTLTQLKSRSDMPDDSFAVGFFEALCYEELGLQRSAIESYEELLRLNGSCSIAWSNLGLLYANQGNSQEAIEAYQSAIRCDSDNAYPYNNLAALYLKQKESALALEMAEKALKLDASLYQAASTAAVASAFLGDSAQAEAYYQRYALSASQEDAAALRHMLQF